MRTLLDWRGRAVLASLAFILLCVAMCISDRGMFPDENVLVAAVRAVRAGTPLERVPGWYWPDVCAQLGSWLGRLVGDRIVVIAVRAANLFGFVMVAGATVRAVALGNASLPRRWTVAGLGAVGAIVLYAFSGIILVGNVTGVLVALILLASASSRGWMRAGLLSVGFLFKPYAIGVVLTRPWKEAAFPAAVAIAAFFDTSGRGALANLDASSNASPVRAFHDLGIPLPWQIWSGLALAAGAWRSRGSWSRGMCVSWLALPLAWDHSVLLLIVPWALAVGRAFARPPGHSRALELCGLALAGAVLAQARAFGLPDGPAWASGVLGLMPGLAALGVAWRTGDPK